MRSHTITVVASNAKEGRCRYCRERILWVTTASEPRRPARTLPFNVPRPIPLSVRRNDESGIVFEVWSSASLHTETCRRRTS